MVLTRLETYQIVHGNTDHQRRHIYSHEYGPNNKHGHVQSPFTYWSSTHWFTLIHHLLHCAIHGFGMAHHWLSITAWVKIHVLLGWSPWSLDSFWTPGLDSSKTTSQLYRTLEQFMSHSLYPLVTIRYPKKIHLLVLESNFCLSSLGMWAYAKHPNTLSVSTHRFSPVRASQLRQHS